ncbi:hypothetical protein SEA_LIGMA_81 [Gordonia phage Ligma]|nr:hypothetical protein SEA_LIGMA_81 [Gordonia phage Ligma]UQT02180.1 hypothetical protein SEA_AXUMITE_81 [Gordonia phage Axumite]
MISITTKFGTTDALADDMFAGLLEAADTFGQVTWTKIGAHQARGTFTGTDGGPIRLVVADLDDISARQALDIASWVNGMIAD